MRGQYHYRPVGDYSDKNDRILSAISYLTFGWGGFIWLAITHFKGKHLSPFARYHVIQSLFVYILISVFIMAVNLLTSIIGIIPFLGNLIITAIQAFTIMPLILGFSIFDFIRLALYIYLPIMAYRGKYAQLPWISNIVRQMS